MEDHLLFISQITQATGITYDKITEVYKENESRDHDTVCQLFMDKFQISYGFAKTLADIIIDLNK